MKVTSLQYAKTLFDLTDGKTEQEVSDIIGKFAEQLKKDGNLKDAKKVMEKFSELFNLKNGIVEAGVTSSRELSSDQVHQVKSFLKEKYSAKEVVINNIVDAKIQGGIIIKVEDEILDASISNHLKRLGKILAS